MFSVIGQVIKGFPSLYKERIHYMGDYSSLFRDMFTYTDYLLGDKQAEEPDIVEFLNAYSAASMLYKHIIKKSKIAIHTDVDMDGIAVCYVVRNWLLQVAPNSQIDCYINSKKVHGVEADAIDIFNVKQYDLVMILDSATNHIEHIKRLNCDCIVIDHHEISVGIHELSGKTQKGEYYVVNSMANNGAVYTGCNTMSAGLTAYEFLRYMQKQLNMQDLLKSLKLYHWAVISLYTDYMNNDNLRNIYYIQTTRNDIVIEPGLMQMLNSANCYPGYLNKSDIGFTLAPLFNRAIRAGWSSIALECALTQPKMVGQLEVYRQVQDEQTKDFDVNINQKSKYITKDITNTATHPNYAGLVAMKLLDKHSVTSAVYHDIGDGLVGGSFRGSSDKVDYRSLLKNMGYYAEGHKSAFGFKIPKDKIDDIMETLVSYEKNGLIQDYITAGYVVNKGVHHIDDIIDFQNQQYLWKLGNINSMMATNINITIQTSELEYVKVNSKHTFYTYSFNGIELIAFEQIETPQAYIYVELQDSLRLYVKNKWVK